MCWGIVLCSDFAMFLGKGFQAYDMVSGRERASRPVCDHTNPFMINQNQTQQPWLDPGIYHQTSQLFCFTKYAQPQRSGALLAGTP